MASEDGEDQEFGGSGSQERKVVVKQGNIGLVKWNKTRTKKSLDLTIWK